MTSLVPGPGLSEAEPHAVRPHRRLMAAVLKRAIDDVWASADRTPEGIRCVRKARAYVASDDRAWPFSFRNLCEALGYDARVLRRALHRATNDVESLHQAV